MAIYRCAACGAVHRVPAPATAQGATCSRCRRELDLSGQPQAVDAAALVSALSACPSPVLVAFSGDGPASPELMAQARTLAGELLVLHVDQGAEPAAALAYRVGRAPTLVLFAEGAEVARHPGSAWPDLSAAVTAPRSPGR